MPKKVNTAELERERMEKKPFPGKVVQGESMKKKLAEAKAFSATIKGVRKRQPA